MSIQTIELIFWAFTIPMNAWQLRENASRKMVIVLSLMLFLFFRWTGVEITSMNNIKLLWSSFSHSLLTFVNASMVERSLTIWR